MSENEEENGENLPVIVEETSLEEIAEEESSEETVEETQLVNGNASYRIAERVTARLAYEPEDDDPRDKSVESVMEILDDMPEIFTAKKAIAGIVQEEYQKYLLEDAQVSNLSKALIEKKGTDLFYEIKNIFNCTYEHNAKIALGEFIVKSREVITLLAENLGIKKYAEKYQFNGKRFLNASDALKHSREKNFEDPSDYQATITFESEYVKGEISTINKTLWFPLPKTEKRVSLVGIVGSAVAYMTGIVGFVAAASIALISGSMPICAQGMNKLQGKNTYADGFSLTLNPVNNTYSELDLKKYYSAKKSLDEFFDC